MEDFWKYAAMSLVTVILAAQLKAKPDMAALLNLAACAMAAMGALGLFAPVVSLLGELETLGDLEKAAKIRIRRIFLMLHRSSPVQIP